MKANRKDLNTNSFPNGSLEQSLQLSGEPIEINEQGALVRSTMGTGTRHILATPSQHAFENLFELSPDAILISDAQGLIRSANPRSVEMFGYTPAELSGKPIDGLVPERFRTRHPSHRREYAAYPATRQMGATLNLFGLRKNGTEFPVDIMLRPIETASGAGVMSHVRDLTEQRTAQQTARSIDQQFRSVVESVSDYAIYLLDPDGHVIRGSVTPD